LAGTSPAHAEAVKSIRTAAANNESTRDEAPGLCTTIVQSFPGLRKFASGERIYPERELTAEARRTQSEREFLIKRSPNSAFSVVKYCFGCGSAALGFAAIRNLFFRTVLASPKPRNNGG
jgi:hypothetical protein